MCTETFVFKDPERYQSMSILTSEFIPPSKPTPPSESDTHCASLANSLPFSLATSTWDYFENQCLMTNPSYDDSSNVCRDTLDNFQIDMHPLAPESHIQWPSTPLLPLFWVGDDNTVNESAHIAEATLVCNPADIVLPQLPFPSQAKRRAASPTRYSYSGTCSESNACKGDLTFYDTARDASSPSACGVTNNGEADFVLALPQGIMTTGDCGRFVHIDYEGQKYTGVVVDKCMGCDDKSIDVSKALFRKFSPLEKGRLFGAKWYIE
ncbi:hypothetical protein PENANT_c117G10682 [Penicillium antarcticum]|uniref:RlpA-like protein double-psi beta-barrel domain-containing protein n=1 Tax=Penicillium antarcticum TaxID=416450 RepID=A0A1V6PJ99_9EURO|nr:hypothetical protein PENANT_c117G10682 [Penicillium antarcticum]